MSEIGLYSRRPNGTILYVGKDTDNEDWYTIICLDPDGEIHEISLSLDSMDVMVELVAKLWSTADGGLEPIPEELKAEEETNA